MHVVPWLLLTLASVLLHGCLVFAKLEGFDAPCPAHMKRCGDRCVGSDDPSTGCAGLGCAACALPNGIAKCEGGECVVADCDEGSADCDDSPANGCEVELSSDPDNCGVCGKWCCGGDCEASTCRSNALVLTDSTPGSLALDDTRLYWIQKTDVMTVSKRGNETPRRLSGARANLSTLAVGQDRVFFGGTLLPILYTEKVNGGEAQEFYYGGLPPFAGAHSIALNGTFAFCLTTPIGGRAELRKFEIDTRSSSTLATGLNEPLGLAADDHHVYFMADSALRKVSWKEDTAPVDLATGLSEPAGPVLNESHVYWLEAGSAFRVPKDGGKKERLADSPPVDDGGTADVAVDDKDAFFTNFRTGIYRVPKDGGTPQHWVTDLDDEDGFGDIEVDESCTYWAQTGVIHVLAK